MIKQLFGQAGVKDFMDIVLFATSWGAGAGGINVFNRELALALAAELGRNGRVFCILPYRDLDDGVVPEVHDGVQKFTLTELDSGVVYPQQLIELRNWMQCEDSPTQPITWIGHDIVTGKLAIAAAAEVGGGSLIIHHMSYANYYLFKGSTSVGADKRVSEQRELFSKAGKIAAVGPLLRRSASELSGRNVIELIPGFPAFPTPTMGENSAFTSITFGRMSSGDDRIKQGRLASAAFGLAIRKAGEFHAGRSPMGRPRPRLYVIGLDEGSSDEVVLRDAAEQAASRAVMVYALPYDSNRNQILERIQNADLAMMLSWHDGFGLAGWEAVAAKTPLIVSKHTGLYELIERETSDAGLACIQAVDIEGQSAPDHENAFTVRDQQEVSTAILAISEDHHRAKQNASTLRALLESKMDCTWRGTAMAILGSLGSPSMPIDRSPKTLDRSSLMLSAENLAARTEVRGHLLAEHWNTKSDRERLSVCHFIEGQNSGELRLQEMRSYSVGGIGMNAVPTFLHMATGVELQLVLGGSFTMGDVDLEREHRWNKGAYTEWRKDWSIRTTPAHRRHISAFFLSKFPILQEQWDRFKADFRLRDKRTSIGPRLPLDGISWHDLQDYLRATGFQLPSEAQWEWACGAGSPTRFYWGDEFDPTYCWYRHNALGSIHAADEHFSRPNTFGLVDMLGNVWEWCADDWNRDYEGQSSDETAWFSTSPQRQASMRGGGWNNWPPTCRTRFRSYWAKEDRLKNTGFRVARSIFLNR